MGTSHNGHYPLLNMPAFLQIGGNMSSCAEAILFDNYVETPGNPPSKTPFGNKPMKLQSYVLVVCREGRLDYRLDCNRPLRLNGGDLVFCQQGQIVEFLGAEPDIKVMFIAFSQDIIISLERFLPNKDSRLAMSFTPSAEFMDELHTHYRLMKTCIDKTADPFREGIIHSYTYIVLLKLISAYNEWLGGRDSGQASANRQLEIYHRFVNLVKDDYRAHRNLEHYASALFISPGHLSRIVKSVSGKTAMAWIRDYVILEAKVMLKSSDLTIAQIGDYLNFPNPSFFSRYFRENTGMPPGLYRRT